MVVDPVGTGVVTVVVGAAVVEVVGGTEVEVVDVDVVEVEVVESEVVDVLEVVVVPVGPVRRVFTVTEFPTAEKGSVGRVLPKPARSTRSYPVLGPGGATLWTTKVTLAPDARPPAGT